MAARKFLSGISADYVKDLDTPLLLSDATNKEYVDLRAVPVGGAAGQVLTKAASQDYDTYWATPSGGTTPPVTGTNISIDMGTFPEPINANIDAGGFT